MTQPVEFRIEKAVYGGDGLAHLPATGRHSGKAVFIPFTLPGETVEASLLEEKRNFARAEAIHILTKSTQRVAPPCPYFAACGGCQYQHAQYEAQLAMKREILRETLSRAAVPLPQSINTLAGEQWAYRNRVRFAFTADGKLAYRSRASHALIEIASCPIAAPVLLTTAHAIAEWSLAHPAPVALQEIELFTNHDESALLVTLYVEKEPEIQAAQTWLADLQAAMPAPLTGLRMEAQNGGLEPKLIASSGQNSLSYRVANTLYRVDAGAFFQINRHLLDRFVQLVNGYVPAAKLVWDLYAGVGLFARQLAARCERVHAVEIAPASQIALAHNLSGMHAEPITSTTLDYLKGNRERREARPDAIVLDPPRAGLGPEVTQLLNAIHAPEMVYVSCDPTTLTRDLKALTAERYRIEAITLVDMFPQTFHMETVVHLRRS
jgi:23S rRNA (uracil1939-C5)-methyltransferase